MPDKYYNIIFPALYSMSYQEAITKGIIESSEELDELSDLDDIELEDEDDIDISADELQDEEGEEVEDGN